MKAVDGHNYKLTGHIDSPLDIDYDIMGFHKKRYIVKGELVKVEYYRNYDGITYSDLVIEELRVYNRDALGIILTRDISIKWFLTDDSIGDTKSWVKYYSGDEAISEGITRRKNMINTAKTVLLNMLAVNHGTPLNQQYAFDFLSSISLELKYFEEGYRQPLIDAVNNSIKPYMSATIKTAVAEELII